MAGEKSDDELLASVLNRIGTAEPVVDKPVEKPKPRPRPQAVPTTWTLPGFHAKAKISTSFGDLPIEALRRRDRVRTLSGAFAEIAWVDCIRLDVEFLEGNPDAHPVLIRTSALGPKKPLTNLLVSPAQMLVTGKDSAKSALELTQRPGIMRLPHAGFVYYRFHCGSEVSVSVDGLWFKTAPQ